MAEHAVAAGMQLALDDDVAQHLFAGTAHGVPQLMVVPVPEPAVLLPPPEPWLEASPLLASPLLASLLAPPELLASLLPLLPPPPSLPATELPLEPL